MSSKLISSAYGCIDFSCYFRRAQYLGRLARAWVGGRPALVKQHWLSCVTDVGRALWLGYIKDYYLKKAVLTDLDEIWHDGGLRGQQVLSDFGELWFTFSSHNLPIEARPYTARYSSYHGRCPACIPSSEIVTEQKIFYWLHQHQLTYSRVQTFTQSFIKSVQEL